MAGTQHLADPGVSWSGTVAYGPGPLHAPASVPELQALVAGASRIRALGTRHSFSTIAASDGPLVTLRAMPAEIEVDTVARTVRVAAGVRYGEVARAVEAQGLALANMGSLPHISVGGAGSTGTHGSGDDLAVLAASVRAVEMAGAEGDLVRLTREDDPEVFGGVVLSLGVLGVFTHLTLDLEPAADWAQVVHRDVPAAEVTAEGLDALLGGATSVSLFHRWDGRIDQVWSKQRLDPDREVPAQLPPEIWHGARRSPDPVHPLPELSADSCTDQSGTPGPFVERLPHFRMEFTPSAGEEIQSEYLVARGDVAAALAAVSELGERIRPLLYASELRTVAADELWLSPAHGRTSACVRFTWRSRPAEVKALLPAIEKRLAPFALRPHWGKVFTTDPTEVRAQYPRLEDFRTLRDRLDPDRVFANAFVDRLLGD